MKIAVCDGTELCPKLIESEILALAAETGTEADVSVYPNLESLRTAVSKEKFDLLMLETEIGGESAIDFARELRLAGNDCDIIFVTQNADYALAAYDVFPIGYIIKPLTKKKLRPPFRYAAKRFSSRRLLLLRTKAGGRLAIPIDSIVYIEVSGTELILHCGASEYEAAGALSDVCTHLPVEEFYRSHRSFVVNMSHTVRLSEYFFEMDTGERVSVAKNRYAEAKQALKAFVGSGIIH